MRLLNPPSFPSVGLLSLRIVVGITFLVHGLHKLTDLSGAERLFTSYSIPAPGVMAVVVGVVETEGGLLLIAGLATQLAAAVLAGDMVVALVTAHDDLRFFATEGGIELEVLLLGLVSRSFSRVPAASASMTSSGACRPKAPTHSPRHGDDADMTLPLRTQR
jgi:putative oxidoreductase